MITLLLPWQDYGSRSPNSRLASRAIPVFYRNMGMEAKRKQSNMQGHNSATDLWPYALLELQLGALLFHQFSSNCTVLRTVQIAVRDDRRPRTTGL